MNGTLFVVATPIGNREDITLRALRILKEADIIAAEDTRHTGNLLKHFEIRNHSSHATKIVIPKNSSPFGRRKNVTLVTDAGTPEYLTPNKVRFDSNCRRLLCYSYSRSIGIFNRTFC